MLKPKASPVVDLNSAAGGIQATAFWRCHGPWFAGLWYVAALVLTFPPFNCPWLVLCFLMPLVGWALTLPRWRSFLAVSVTATWAAWFLILIWLRFIYPPWGWVALTALSAALAAFPATWLAALRWAAPRMQGGSGWQHSAVMVGLAGLWVVLDWVRSWLFTGFPWLPLAAAFWKYPMFLQPAAWTGQWGVTWLIVLFNLAVVFNWRRAEFGQEKLRRVQRWSWYFQPEAGGLALAVFVLLLWSPIYTLTRLAQRPQHMERLLRAGLVQPWTPADLKWDETKEMENWQALRDLTLGLRGQNVDVVVWPEAAPPFAVLGPGTENGRAAVQQIVDAEQKPLILGAVALRPSPLDAGTGAGDYNAVFVMNPGSGLEPEFYAKRKRVPFGEYVPGRDWFPFLGKVVPLPADTLPGRWAQPLPLTLPNGRVLQAGPLVCYEDIFPALAREQARAGADFLVIVTNDAWYGVEGGALQHAAHAVLRAVETRRPILRCGNDGWSGWIDEYGYGVALEKIDGKVVPQLIMDDPEAAGTTYFRGAGTVGMYRDLTFAGQDSFYVRYGDWFVALSAGLALLAAAWLLKPIRIK
jgi:apolipoprotein N-acyltransferase